MTRGGEREGTGPGHSSDGARPGAAMLISCQVQTVRPSLTKTGETRVLYQPSFNGPSFCLSNGIYIPFDLFNDRYA